MPEDRKCPQCGHKNVLVLKAKENYKLACRWCAYQSEPVTAIDAFFHIWNAPPDRNLGDSFTLVGIPYYYRGEQVASRPIRVVYSGETAMVASA